MSSDARVEAMDLLNAQRELKAREADVSQAWSAIRTAEQALEQAKANHDLARSIARDALEELEMLEAEIAEQASVNALPKETS